jgi:hypothetical protein
VTKPSQGDWLRREFDEEERIRGLEDEAVAYARYKAAPPWLRNTKRPMREVGHLFALVKVPERAIRAEVRAKEAAQEAVVVALRAQQLQEVTSKVEAILAGKTVEKRLCPATEKLERHYRTAPRPALLVHHNVMLPRICSTPRQTPRARASHRKVARTTAIASAGSGDDGPPPSEPASASRLFGATSAGGWQ